MASGLARAKLARAARRLNEHQSAGRWGENLPPLVLMTDDVRIADPISAARALPPGSAIILRHRDASERARLGHALGLIARQRDLDLLIAGDENLAQDLNADGVHLPEAKAGSAFHCRAIRPDWLITVSAHSEAAILKAFRADADAILLAPLFPTKSHPDKPGIGTARSCLIAARAPLPVYALGGINSVNVGRLFGAEFAGISAIEALLPD